MRFFSIGLLVFLSGRTDPALAADEAPDFKEVYGLIQSHLAGVSPVELDRAAVRGLIAELDPRVSLVSASPSTPSRAALVTRNRLFDGQVAYVRVGCVADGLAKAVGDAYRHLGSTNPPVGLVLDLRYADGDDY
jgi:hypothetical protein